MKRKFIISSVLALCCTASCISAVSASAENYDYFSRTDGHIMTLKMYETSEGNENFVNINGIAHLSRNTNYGTHKSYIDIESDEFKTFIKNAHKINYELIPGKCYFIGCAFLGFNEDGEAVFGDNPIANGYELDENNNPVFTLDYGDPAIECLYGFSTEKNEYIGGGFNRILIRVDENGEPQVVETEYVNPDLDITKTIDINTGEEILVKDIMSLNCKVIETGDATTDGSIDVRDVTLYNQSVVKLKEIPDYAEKVADINTDGTIDLKDLGLLKQYIIGVRDSL